MVSQTICINNASGLHARPASVFVAEAKKVQGTVTIYSQGKEINCKSIIAVLSAGLLKGSEVELRISGENEAAELKRLADCIENGLGE